jgi:hypothetical protein
MMIPAAIGSGSFVFGTISLFWWHPGTSFDVRISLAGIYLLVTSVAVAGICVLTRLDALKWRTPR